jgi:hypothetical protein
MSAAGIEQRFKGVENSPAPTPEQLERVKLIRSLGLELALQIDASDLAPRYRATALTELESAIMFAVKGVFQPHIEA